MNNTLYIGSKFYGHDSAIFVVLPQSKEIFAMATERLSRYKHDTMYPIPVFQRLLEFEKIDKKQVKKVYFANSVLSQKNEPTVIDEYNLTIAHRKHFKSDYVGDYCEKKEEFDNYSSMHKLFHLLGSRAGIKILKYVVLKKLKFRTKETLNDTIKRQLKAFFPNADIYVNYFDHHFCHALSSYHSSSFKDALLVTSDGWGDDIFSSVYVVVGDKVSRVAVSETCKINLVVEKKEQKANLSVGLIYSYITEQLGFKFSSDEGKVEALAAYGVWDNEIYNFLIKNTKVDKEKCKIILEGGAMEKFLAYENFKKLLSELSREDVAAAVQKYLEDIHLEYISFLVKKTGIKNLCFSGGVAANVILNLKIFETITKNIHIAPAMADDGTAQGAAINLLLNNGFSANDLAWLKHEQMPYFATSYSKKEVLREIEGFGSNILWRDLGEAWPQVAAKLVASGKIGAVFHGRMEWGPRALGNRSIIADPRRVGIRKLINLNIKKRPEFQPFCPSILLEEKDRLFNEAYNNKHMTCAFRMKPEFWEKLPGAIHIDGTSRVQFVEERDNPKYYSFLKELKKLTGFGVTINTSFNKHGRTIVESPKDALIDFYDTNLDFLIIEGILIKK